MATLFSSPPSLRKAHTLAGFKLEKLEYVGRSLTLDRLAYNIGVMTKRPAAQRALGSLSRRMYLHKLSVTINVHEIMQRVWLTKPVARPEDASVSCPPAR